MNLCRLRYSALCMTREPSVSVGWDAHIDCVGVAYLILWEAYLSAYYLVWGIESSGISLSTVILQVLGVASWGSLLRAILFANHKANGAVTNIGLSS